jgi:hypothetical protein
MSLWGGVELSDFGLYANPVEKIPGVGKIIDLYKKFNFRKTGVKNITNKIVICMELEK